MTFTHTYKVRLTDFTKEAFSNFGYEILFDKVEIKPGKPTTLGKIGDKIVNFELFGRSIIYAMSGAKAKFINPVTAKMKNDVKLRAGRRTVIPGYFDGEYFTVCEQYSPGMISPLAQANAFIIVSENSDFIAKESEVKIISTKFSFTSQKFQEMVTH